MNSTLHNKYSKNTFEKSKTKPSFRGGTLKREKSLNIDALYNDILHRLVETKVGINSTYSSTLENIGDKLLFYKFRGVYASDKIPQLNDIKPYCILNLDKSNEPGSHWIALAKKKDKNECLVYDSFGRNYKKIISPLGFSGNGRIYNTDKDAEQKISEQNCGARCLAFLVFFDKYGWNKAIKI
jgi:hypothetical protein